MNEQGKIMMNPQQRMSMGQSQMMNPQLQQQQQPQMMNRSYMMWPQQFQNPNPNPNPILKQFGTGKHLKGPLGPRNNWKGKKVNKNIGGGANAVSVGGNVGGVGGYKPPTLNDLQRQNRVKAKRFFPKKKFYHNNNNNNMTAPYAPRNTSSYIIRAKKSGGIASLVSPCPVTPAVLPTPIFSPSREDLVDMAKEVWGVDGYGSMNGLIRLRSPGHEAEDEEDEEGGGSSESDVEEHVEVERRLDHDLSRFEMIYPNYSGMEYSNVLGNRVDDQDTHIAQLEEENLILKDRLFLMEREVGDLRRRLQSLERQGGHGCEEMNEEVVENGSENESESHGDGSNSLEDNNVVLVEGGHMDGVGKEEKRVEDDAESEENKEKVGKEEDEKGDGDGNGNGNDEAVGKNFNLGGKKDEEVDCDETNGAFKTGMVADVVSKGETDKDIDVTAGNVVQLTQLNKKTENEVQASGNASVGDVAVEEASRVEAEVVSKNKKTENEVQASGNASVGDVAVEEASRVHAEVVSENKKEE